MGAPGDDVLAAFGLAGEPERLAGGQGSAFVVAETVLKPGGELTGEWAGSVLSALPEDGFRVPRPRPRVDGLGWVVDGWSASERVPGKHRTRDADWPQALDVAVRLHRALRTAPRPAFATQRTDVFAVADRMAWGEAPLPVGGRLADALRRLAGQQQPLRQSPSVVHGDLAGNLLWHPHLPPAVIDFSPYWRPSGLGAAQLVVDATLWYGADDSLAEALLRVEPVHGRQLVLRALMFRLGIDALLDAGADEEVRWDRSLVDRDLAAAEPLGAWITAVPRRG